MSLASNQVPIYAVVPKSGRGVIGTGANTPAAGAIGADTNGIQIYAAGANGSIITSLVLNTSDTAAVNVLLYILNGANVTPLGIVNVPLNSGNAANTLNVDALDPSVLKGLPMDNTGKRYIILGASDILKMSPFAAMTANKQLWASFQGGDF